MPATEGAGVQGGSEMVDVELHSTPSNGTTPVAKVASSGSDVKASNPSAQLVFDSTPSHSEMDNQSNTGEKKEKHETVSLGQLFRFATATDVLSMVIAALGAGVVGAAQPGMIILFADLMDVAGGQNDPNTSLVDSFNDIAIKMAILGCICFIAAWIGDAGFKTSGLRQSAMWRKHYLKAILSQDIGWYDTNNPGELSSRIAESTQQIEEGISSKLSSLSRNACQGLFGLGVAFYYSWDMALVLLALSPIVMFGAWFMTKTTTESAGDMANAYAKAGGTASETISELRTVSAMNAEKMQADKYSKNLEDARKADVRKSYRVGFANGLMFSSGNMMAGVGFIYGSIKIARELESTTQMVSIDGVEFETNCANQEAVAAGVIDACSNSGGDILVALFALQIGAQGLGLLEPSITALNKARTAAWGIIKTMDRLLTINAFSQEGLKPQTVRGQITFRDVHFAYPSRPDQKVANGYNLTVEAGSTVALVGASGSGKSTAIQLVERFYDPDQGEVTLDGTDLKTLNVQWLRQQIGLVGQEPVLFSGTIAENIAHGKEGATREEVVAAAKMANAHDFITAFPTGYDTDVGEKGGQLSGGQKQRVAIARAMIKNPSVLLLDEATSALDNESERVVQAALDDLMTKHKRTTIVIAHRLSTIRNADKIVVVDKGRVVEQGTHDELMALSGQYFALAASHGLQGASPARGAAAL